MGAHTAGEDINDWVIGREFTVTMTRKEMAESIFGNTGIMKKDCVRIVDSVIEIISKELEKGNTVEISGFGKWTIKDKLPRKGRNPQTGEPITIRGRRVVMFKYFSMLRRVIATNAQST